MRCLEQYPQIELWDEDGMHPSLEGSYLAACIAYAVIFQESPVGCSYTAELDGETAAQLQEPGCRISCRITLHKHAIL